MEIDTVIHSRLRRPHGFTLIEVMVVVAIIGILATIAVPLSRHYINKSHYSAALIESKELLNAFMAFYIENDMYPNSTSRPAFDRRTFSPLEFNGKLAQRMVNQQADRYDSPDDMGSNQEFYVRMTLARDPRIQFVVANSNNVDLEPGVWLNGVFVYRDGVRVR